LNPTGENPTTICNANKFTLKFEGREAHVAKGWLPAYFTD